MKIIGLAALVLIGLLLFLGSSCGGGESQAATPIPTPMPDRTPRPENRSPVIDSLTASRAVVPPQGVSAVRCVASDPDGDTLSYAWTTTGGDLARPVVPPWGDGGADSGRTWTAPKGPGPYEITVTASDGRGGTATESVSIVVDDTPPAVTVAVSPANPTQLDTVRFRVTAWDSSGIAGIELWVDGERVDECSPTLSRRFATCTLVAGPFPAGAITYGVLAFDKAGNSHDTRWESLPITGAAISVTNVAPSEDSYVNVIQDYAGPRAVPYGDQETLEVGMAFGVNDCRTFLKFPIQSYIPEGSVVDAAKLRLVCSGVVFSDMDTEVTAHKVTGPWSQGTLTWCNQPGFDSAAISPVTIRSGHCDGWYLWEWDIKEIVQSWIDDPTYWDYGVMLKATSQTDSIKQFCSSEDPDWGVRPILEITYYYPI